MSSLFPPCHSCGCQLYPEVSDSSRFCVRKSFHFAWNGEIVFIHLDLILAALASFKASSFACRRVKLYQKDGTWAGESLIHVDLMFSSKGPFAGLLLQLSFSLIFRLSLRDLNKPFIYCSTMSIMSSRNKLSKRPSVPIINISPVLTFSWYISAASGSSLQNIFCWGFSSELEKFLLSCFLSKLYASSGMRANWNGALKLCCWSLVQRATLYFNSSLLYLSQINPESPKLATFKIFPWIVQMQAVDDP